MSITKAFKTVVSWWWWSWGASRIPPACFGWIKSHATIIDYRLTSLYLWHLHALQNKKEHNQVQLSLDCPPTKAWRNDHASFAQWSTQNSLVLARCLALNPQNQPIELEKFNLNFLPITNEVVQLLQLPFSFTRWHLSTHCWAVHGSQTAIAFTLIELLRPSHPQSSHQVPASSWL